MKVAYPGIRGAFAHQACEQLLPHHQSFGLPTFKAVARAVANGTAGAGVLPLTNSIAGDVPGMTDLIESGGLRISDQTLLRIVLHLLGLPGCRIGDLRTVTSHPMALRQCSRKLAELDVELVESPSTAQAARDVIDIHTGALASNEAARIYGLQCLVPDMADEAVSTTIFALVEHRR